MSPFCCFLYQRCTDEIHPPCFLICLGWLAEYQHSVCSLWNQKYEVVWNDNDLFSSSPPPCLLCFVGFHRLYHNIKVSLLVNVLYLQMKPLNCIWIEHSKFTSRSCQYILRFKNKFEESSSLVFPSKHCWNQIVTTSACHFFLGSHNILIFFFVRVILSWLWCVF